jgi:hypothetical protein
MEAGERVSGSGAVLLNGQIKKRDSKALEKGERGCLRYTEQALRSASSSGPGS